MTWLLSAGCYMRTIRHLRARQIAYQILRRLRWNHRSRRSDSGRGPVPWLRWSDEADFPAPTGTTANNQHSIRSGSLEFLNRCKTVGFPPDWNATDLPRLWLYNLHYHEFLWQLDFEQSREVVMDWIANHRSGPARVGWEAYPTSLRLTNWCTLFFGRYRTGTLADEELRETLWASLCEQADHLQRNVEWHLLGNHLLENAIALTLAGSCFKHPVAESWFRKGREILERQLPEQILADGGHFERSPMYQSRILYALLLLSATGDRFLTKLVEPYLGPLAGSLAAMTHPMAGSRCSTIARSEFTHGRGNSWSVSAWNHRESARSPLPRVATTAQEPLPATTSSAMRGLSARTTSPGMAMRTCFLSNCRC